MGLLDPPELVQRDIDADRVHSFEVFSESNYKVVYDLHRLQNTSTNADANTIRLLEDRLAACKREKIILEEAKGTLEEASALLTARCEQLEGSLEEKETELQVVRQNLARCEHDKAQILQKVDKLTAESKEICGGSKEAIATLNGLLLIEQEDKEQIQKAAASSDTKAAKKIQSLTAKLDTSKKISESLRTELKGKEEDLAMERSLKDKAADQVKTNETLIHAQAQTINEQKQTINNTNTQREEEQKAWEDYRSRVPEIVPREITVSKAEGLSKVQMHAQVQKINEQEQTINNTNTQRMEEAQMAWEDINITVPKAEGPSKVPAAKEKHPLPDDGVSPPKKKQTKTEDIPLPIPLKGTEFVSVKAAATYVIAKACNKNKARPSYISAYARLKDEGLVPVSESFQDSVSKATYTLGHCLG